MTGTCDGCEKTAELKPTPDGQALLCEECIAPIEGYQHGQEKRN